MSSPRPGLSKPSSARSSTIRYYLGRRIPDDLAIVGIGEVELGQYLPIPLTYVALPRREAGIRSAELAVAAAQGDEIATPVVKLEVRLVVNGTA